MAKISIIANFYKSERYIPKLIESVIAQTYNDWELLCVNDCSPGRDKEIILKYASKDKRIRLVDNEVNLGICKAKMEGLKHAHTEYVTFIDGDDWYAPEALQRMIESAEKYNLDMVVMNHYRALPSFHYNKRIIQNIDEWNTPIYEPFEKYYVNFFGENMFTTTYWGMLFRREVLVESGLKPQEKVFAEDLMFHLTVFPYVKSLMFVDYYGYYWRWGGYSAGKKSTFWTSEIGMRRSNEIYVDRLHLIEKYNYYDKAYLPVLRQQRKDVLNYMSDLADTKLGSQETNQKIEFISEILNGQSYEKLADLMEHDPAYKDDKLLECILNKDAQGVYLICYDKRKAEARKRILKKSLYRIINLFQ